jgi:hypothetical protein
MKRVHWGEDQIESLAIAFVRLRSHNPFAPCGVLMDKAQEECLIPDQRRPLATVNLVPLLKERIVALYAKSSQAEPPPPQIFEIPVEKPVDLVEISNRLDTPTLMALLTKRFGEVVDKMRFANGNEQHPATARTAAPSVSLLTPKPPETPRKPRVAFCHVELKVFSQLQEQVERNKIPVELRGVEIAHKGTAIPMSCDYVVFMKNAIGGVSWKAAMQTWPHSRISTVDNNVEAALQKMRDIVSMKIHVPANGVPAAQARA